MSDRESLVDYIRRTRGEQVKRGMEVFGNGHESKEKKIT